MTVQTTGKKLLASAELFMKNDEISILSKYQPYTTKLCVNSRHVFHWKTRWNVTSTEKSDLYKTGPVAEISLVQSSVCLLSSRPSICYLDFKFRRLTTMKIAALCLLSFLVIVSANGESTLLYCRFIAIIHLLVIMYFIKKNVKNGLSSMDLDQEDLDH